MSDWSLIASYLRQAVDAAERARLKFGNVPDADAFYATEIGRDALDVICMQLLAVGETMKVIDRMTGCAWVATYEGVDWKGVMGIRDVIAHRYFDIDADELFGVCSERLGGLINALRSMIDDAERRT